MKVLVCGGRTFGCISYQTGDGGAGSIELIRARQAERDFFRDWMDEHFQYENPELIIEGGAKGADTCAFWWAKHNGVKVKTMKADWDTHGKSAGSIRNQAMLNERPDLVIAFPGGPGTADMVRKAKTRGVDVIEVSYVSPVSVG